MSTSATIQKEVAAAVGDAPICIPAPYVKEHGKNQNDVANVNHDLVVFFSLRGDGAHYRDARGWSHTKMTKMPSPSLWFFQLLLLMAETREGSSLRPRADRFSDPEGYKNAVKLTARVWGKGNSQISPGDAKELSKSLVSDHYIDLRFLHEVSQERKRQQEGGARVTDARNAGRGRGRGAPPQPDPVVRSPPRAPPQARGPPGGVEWARRVSLRVTRHIEEAIGLNVADPAWENIFVPPSEVAGAADGLPYNGPERLPKVEFSVTPVPDKDGETMGIICRFMIHDPALHPMLFFDKVVKNSQSRVAQQISGGGGGGISKGGRSSVMNKEAFPSYSGLFFSQHPVSNNTRYETYFECAIRQCPDLLASQRWTREELFGKLQIYVNSPENNELHITKLLTMQRALDQAIKSGADPVALGRLSRWTSANGVARFPLETYKYRPEQLFWRHPKLVGLMEQYFPQIDTGDDFTASLIANRSLSAWLAPKENQTLEEQERQEEEQELEMRNAFDQSRLLIQDSITVNRSDVMGNRLVHYDTPNAFVHRAAEAERIYKAIEKQRPTHYAQTQSDVMAVRDEMRQGNDWRTALMTREREVELFLAENVRGKYDAARIITVRRGLSLLTRVQECERFNAILSLTQQGRLKVFSSLWLVEGEVDDLPVPDSLRAMMRWFRERRSGPADQCVKHLTREFMMYDPELGIFGNSMLRQIKMFSCVGLILQPIICMLTEGLFSCFRWSPKKLAFNLLFHGRFDTGKTHAAITTLMKLVCIEGTVLPYVSQTKAADTTMRHYYDLIIASDEVPQRKVSQHEAEKDPEGTNKDKIKLTDRAVAVNVFTYETDPSGNQVRWARTFRTDHYVALVEVTNHVVEATSALASRYFRLTVAQPRLEARKLQNDSFVSSLLKGDMVGYLNTNQYLSACTYKAIQVGVMQEPHMGLFVDIANRVIDYLQTVKAISRDTGARGLEIMIPYAIQMVIHNAIHCAFDLPGSANYYVEFTAERIKEVEPYLYCTVDIAWWCWTALASGWIEESNCNVIESAVRSIGLAEWGSSADSITPYEMYELDINDRIPWRRRHNAKDNKNPLIDLQYITLYGTKEQVARQIAASSNPHLDWTDVVSVFNSLSTKMVPVPWDVYRPMPESEMKAWHQFKELPRDEVTVAATKDRPEMRDRVKGVKDVPRTPGQSFPKDFCISNSDPTQQRTVKDMPRVGPNQELVAVDMSEPGKVHIMPWVAEYFRSARVIEALEYATVSAGMPADHKILMGMHLPNDQQNFQCGGHTAASLEQCIISLDRAAGWSDDGKTWLGDPKIPPEKRTPSRRVGISFDRQAALSKADSVYFNSVSAAPTNMSHSEWRSRSEADTALMQQVRQVFLDLDFTSAQHQHCRSGQPLDAPVRSPAWIEQEYRRNCALLKRPWTENKDYPHDSVLESADNREYWTTADSIRAVTKAMPELAKIRAEASKPRKRTAPTTEVPLADVPAEGAASVKSRQKLSVPTISQAQRNLLDEV